MKVLDLFSGIGGFSLGLERAGFQTVAFCEIEPYCRRVLAKNFPGVPIYDDVRTLTAAQLAADGIVPDMLAGGFPCQDISTAGKGAGIEGERSGLWREFARLVGECRPDWVIVENVPALRSRGADVVLADLEEAGYAARPLVVGAVHAGAPHRRQRVWIVANNAKREWRGGELADSRGGGEERWSQESSGGCSSDRLPPYPHGQGEHAGAVDAEVAGIRSAVADADSARLAVGAGVGGDAREERSPTEREGWWISEPDVGRVANGVSRRVDRLRGLGNAVVPQVVEAIGRAILKVC